MPGPAPRPEPVDRTRTTPESVSGGGGSIYDLGYQGYTGPRLGRRAAIGALFWQTVRSAYGIGRGGRAKIVPFALAALALLPAVVAVGFTALIAQAGPGGSRFESAQPIRYSSYHSVIGVMVMLYCAAQAPELLGPDQRHGVLPLYFSRALQRLDYALARALGLMGALLVLVLLPQLVLFVGRVLTAADPVTGFSAEFPSMPPAIIEGLLTAGLLGGIATAVSAYTPRRAYATAAIIALFIIPPIVVSLVGQLGTGDLAGAIVLVSPGDVLEGASAFLFNIRAGTSGVRNADLPGLAYVGTAIVGTALTLLITIRRYLRVQA